MQPFFIVPFETLRFFNIAHSLQNLRLAGNVLRELGIYDHLHDFFHVVYNERNEPIGKFNKHNDEISNYQTSVCGMYNAASYAVKLIYFYCYYYGFNNKAIGQYISRNYILSFTYIPIFILFKFYYKNKFILKVY